MPRYNTVSPTSTVTTTSTIPAPTAGLLTTFTGTAPYTVTLADPALYSGQTQYFWNNTGGVVTLSLVGVTNSPSIRGPASNTGTTYPLLTNCVIGLTSDGTNYVITSFVGQLTSQFYSVDVTGSITARAGQILWCNTSGGAFTVTLPANPQKGDTVRIVDIANTFNTNTLTVGRNGQPINSDTSGDLTVTTQGAAFDLMYYDATRGWRIFTI